METKVAPYDDAYAILARQLVVDLNYGDICRTLWDDEFIKRMVQKETRSIDFYGPFLDCIVEQILVKKQRMMMMHELDKLGEFFFNNLSLLNLREHIQDDLDRFKIPWREAIPVQFSSDFSSQTSDESEEDSQSQSDHPESASLSN